VRVAWVIERKEEGKDWTYDAAHESRDEARVDLREAKEHAWDGSKFRLVKYVPEEK
jgi:hypothetical protein